MVMDKGEILRDYNQALHKTEQVYILADLNACSPMEIVDVLVEQGIERQQLGRVIGNLKKAPKKAKAKTEQTVSVPHEITVAEAVERLKREVDELEKRRLEIDNERAELYSIITGLLR